MPHSSCQEPTSNPTVVPWALTATGPCRISTYSSLHLPTIIISRGSLPVRATALPESLRKININIRINVFVRASNKNVYSDINLVFLKISERVVACTAALSVTHILSMELFWFQ